MAEVGSRKSEVGEQRTDDRGRNAEDQVIELEFCCRTPGLAQEPVVVTVFHEEEVLDKVVFGGRPSEMEDKRAFHGVKKKGNAKIPSYTVKRRYDLASEDRGQRTEDKGHEMEKLMIEVSRTWVPHEVLGNFDRREMGVGVKILKPDN